MSTRAVPMFPLGMVLFPHSVMPLHVFEPRYRALTEDCLRGDGKFGVVLIERGSEVGGGDTRFDFGTMAQISEAARTPDGRYLLAAVGTDRIRVKSWLADDPYPRAMVEVIAEPDRVPARAADQRKEVGRLLEQAIALGSELGYKVSTLAGARLDEDPLRASYEAAARAPIASLDAQRLLLLDDPSERFDELARLLAETVELFEFRLSRG